MATPSARWTNDPRQGSAFHELLVLPTLAPNLARPYYTPGTPEYHAAEAARRQEAAAEGNAGMSLVFWCYMLCITIETDMHIEGNPGGPVKLPAAPPELPAAPPTGMCSVILKFSVLTPCTLQSMTPNFLCLSPQSGLSETPRQPEAHVPRSVLKVRIHQTRLEFLV